MRRALAASFAIALATLAPPVPASLAQAPQSVQQRMCDFAKADWKNLVPSYLAASIAQRELQNGEVVAKAAGYIEHSSNISSMLARCGPNPGAGYPSAQEISSAVRTASQGMMFCAQVSPIIKERLGVLEGSASANSKRVAAEGYTSLARVVHEMTIGEATYIEARVADMASAPGCKGGMDIDAARARLVALAPSLQAASAKAQAAAQACQAALTSIGPAMQAVATLGAEPAKALVARDAMAPAKAKATAACIAFPDAVQSLAKGEQDLDVALGRGDPACNAAIQSTEPHARAYQAAVETRRAAPVAAAVNGFKSASASAKTACARYPGVSARLATAAEQMSANAYAAGAAK